MSETEALIQLVGLSRSYQEGVQTRMVLDGLDAVVARGETVALLGRSGSGKSTLLNLIAGIDLPSAGKIIVAGASLGQLDERKRTLFRRRHIGFVYQFFNLIPTLTVEENISLPAELNGVTRTQARARVAELLHAVGLADRAGTYPDRLSGGEQQRVAIARALAHDPMLVLADEPTGNLDAETGGLIVTLLRDLVRGRGKTMIIATHSADLTGIADRVMTLESGRFKPSVSP